MSLVKVLLPPSIIIGIAILTNENPSYSLLVLVIAIVHPTIVGVIIAKASSKLLNGLLLLPSDTPVYSLLT